MQRKRILNHKREIEMHLTNKELGRLVEDISAKARKVLSFVNEDGEVTDQQSFANHANVLRECLISNPEN